MRMILQINIIKCCLLLSCNSFLLVPVYTQSIAAGDQGNKKSVCMYRWVYELLSVLYLVIYR